MYNNGRSVDEIKMYDPRVKLYIVLIYLIMTLVSWNVWSVIWCAVVAVYVVYLCRIRVAIILNSTKLALCLELIMGIILMFPFGFKIGLFVAVKLVTFTLVYYCLIRNLKQVEVLDGLMLGFRMKANAARRLSLVMDYLPKVEKEKKRALRAQKARGVDPDEGNIFERFRKEALVRISNYQYAYIKTKRQNRAMIKRHFLSEKRRVRVHGMKFTLLDDIVLLEFLLALLIVVICIIVL